MTTFEAILLGIIQGITEFLPVSSSGHLQLAKSLLGIKHLDKYIIFDMVCHIGTLFSIFIIFSKEIRQSLTDRTRLLQVIIAILPLFPLLLILKPIKSLFAQPEYLGYFFLTTALILYLGVRFGWQESKANAEKKKWRDPFLIGVCQAAAILPGVSRSGSTITGGRLLGWNMQDAISFSFLLAIPTILGGLVVETSQMLKTPEASQPLISWQQYIAGFLASFIMGYAALSYLLKVAGKNKFMYFVWYCLFIGIFSLIYFH